MLLQQYLECLGATGNAEARLGEFIRMAVPGEGKWTFNRETAEYTKEVIEEPAHEPEAIAEPV